MVLTEALTEGDKGSMSINDFIIDLLEEINTKRI